MADKLLFFGKTSDGSKKCIKFTRSYSKDVHLACSTYAPTLRGFEIIAGRWYLVVMDVVDLDVYKPYSNRSMNISSGSFPDVGVLRPQVEKVIKSLHSKGLVHGDVRDTNLLVRTDGECGFVLIDFDWAGKEGEARYPMNVNRNNIRRPEGARDGLPIKQKHDLEMPSIMFDTPTVTRAQSFMNQD